MFAISITLAPGHAQAVLHFRTQAAVDSAISSVHEALGVAVAGWATIRDDFSRVLRVRCADILAICHFEIEAQSESAEAAGLLQQQASARLNQKWLKDPLFRSLQTMAQLVQGGPSPGGVRQ